MKNIYIVSALLILLGFGVRLLYGRLKKAWLITLGMAILTGIAWIAAGDLSSSGNEGEFVLAVLITILLVGTVLGEITVQLLRHRKKKKSPENTPKGEPT